MNERIKRVFKIVLILVVAFVPLYIAPIVRADSGWDSDYDSGSSWDSDYDSGWDSDYDSGSSWDDDYNYSGSSSGSDDDTYSSFIFAVLVTTFIIIIICIIEKKGSFRNNTYTRKTVNYVNPADIYNDITQRQVTIFMPGYSLNTLKNMAFDNFVKIQNAWMNFDYDKIRELCTDELYNSYVSQLETLKLKNGKNIMSDFKQINNKIIDIDEVNGDIILTVFMAVEFYDYVINTSNNNVTRGTKTRKLLNNYVLTYVVKADYNDEENTKCPNCGAPIEHVTSGKCEYCNSTIVKKASKFVLSKKTNVNR